MTSLMWNIVLFSWGFLAGLAAAFGAVLVVRMRREAARDGEQLISRLGAIDARRFLEIAAD